MIRVLVLIMFTGFVVSLASLSAAFALGGPEMISRGGWSWAARGPWPGDHRGWHNDDEPHGRTADDGPQVTRTLAWSGAERLDIDLRADVRYVQAAGPASVTVTGSQRDVSQVVVRGDSIRYQDRHGHWRSRLIIVVRAPNIHSFDVGGASALQIEDYSQPTLDIDASGNAEISVKGQADAVALDLSGSAEADLSGVKAKTTEVDASGSAEAVIAPSERALLDISGSADIRLLTRPATLESDISGAGRLRQVEPEPTAPVTGAKL